MSDSHRYGLKCLKGKNAGAPCLLCGQCPNCCGCKEKLKGRYEPLPHEVAKPVACQKCGVVPEFPAGHAMVCDGKKEA
jgi:hypothetical protein